FFRMKSVALILLFSAATLLEAKMQNVTVKGTTICGKNKLGNVLIELYDKDTIDPDDQLAKVNSNSQGDFIIKGGEDEIGSIEPFIRITHKCKAKAGCSRIAEFEVPKDKIGGLYDMT
ncbi:hypothetical protein PMAYCL1PPCAC_20068, partial [Pristionchus mayeri]